MSQFKFYFITIVLIFILHYNSLVTACVPPGEAICPSGYYYDCTGAGSCRGCNHIQCHVDGTIVSDGVNQSTCKCICPGQGCPGQCLEACPIDHFNDSRCNCKECRCADGIAGLDQGDNCICSPCTAPWTGPNCMTCSLKADDCPAGTSFHQLQCRCNSCSPTNCPTGQYRNKGSCDCIDCPTPCNFSNGGTKVSDGNTSGSCACNCSQLIWGGLSCETCNKAQLSCNASTQIRDSTNGQCACKNCPMCSNGGTITTTNDTCGCSCSGNWGGPTCTTCGLTAATCANSISTFNSAGCSCTACSNTCPSGQIRSSNGSTCSCTGCTNTCSSNQIVTSNGSTTCGCTTCPMCSNGGTITTTGNTCGCSCSGSWSGPTCTTCSLNASSCPIGQQLNAVSCQCVACSGNCLAGQYRNQGSCTCINCTNKDCNGHGTQPISNIQSQSCTCSCRNSWSDSACGTCNLSSCPAGQTLNDCGCTSCPTVGCTGHGTQNSNCSCSCSGNWSGTNCETCGLTTANCASSISILNASTCGCTPCTNTCPSGQIRTSNGSTCSCVDCTNTCNIGQYRSSTDSTTCGCTNCNQNCQNGGTRTSDHINSNSCGCQCSLSTPQWGGLLCNTCDDSKLTCNSATEIKDITNGKCECLTCPTCLHNGELTTTNNQCGCNCITPWTNNRCQDCSLTSTGCGLNEAFLQSSCQCTPCTKTCTTPDVLNYWSCSCVNPLCETTTCPNSDEYINDSTSTCQCEKCPICLNNGIAYSESNQCYCDCTLSNNNGIWIGEQCQICPLIQNIDCTSTQQLDVALCQCNECSTLLSTDIIDSCINSGGNIEFSTTTSQCQCQCPNDKVWNNETNQCELRCQDYNTNYIWNEDELQCQCNLSCSKESNQIPNDNCTECILDESKCGQLGCKNNGKPNNDCSQCECDNELYWIGDKCDICNIQCFSPSVNQRSISCQCLCSRGYIGIRCECIKTSFIITLGSVPKTILTTYQQDPTSLTSTESILLQTVYNSLRIKLDSTSTTIDNIQIESLEIKYSSHSIENITTSLLIRGSFIDGCDTDSSKYSQLLSKWTDFLNQFTTITIDNEEIEIIDYTTESPIAQCIKQTNTQTQICTLDSEEPNSATTTTTSLQLFLTISTLLFLIVFTFF